MQIDVTPTDEERDRLRAVLGSDADVDRLVPMIALAGAAEMVAQASGLAVFSTMTDLRLYRIYRLLAAGIGLGEVERLAPLLFKVPPATGRGLVERAIARYDVELQDAVKSRVVEFLEGARWLDDRWEVELPAGRVRDTVLEFTSGLDLADPVRAGRGTVWQFPDETYQAARQGFGLATRPRPKP